MNRVYGFVAGRARNVFELSMLEVSVMAAAGLLVAWQVNTLLGVAAAIVCWVILRQHARRQHNRPDHLDVLWRRFVTRRTSRLVDRDLVWRPLPHDPRSKAVSSQGGCRP